LNIKFDFPREVLELSTEKGKGFRKLVSTINDFESYWLGKNGVSNAYMTVYGYRATEIPNHKRVNLQTPIIRHFVLDLDAKNFKDRNRSNVDLQETLEQTRRLHTYLLEKGIEHGVWYSGGGFHVWVSLDKAYIPSSGSHVSSVKEALPLSRLIHLDSYESPIHIMLNGATGVSRWKLMN
jgi:DNA primase